MRQILIFFTACLISFSLFSQEKYQKAIEVGLVPFVVYNNLSFAFSAKKNLNEHLIYSKSYLYSVFEYSGYGSSLNYNYNRYLKGNLSEKFYIPFSISAKYEKHYPSGDSESGIQDWGKLFLGSGVGFKPQIYRFKLRFEVLLGTTLFTEYYKERLSLYDDFPIYPAIKMNTRFVFELKQKRPTN